MHPNDPAGIRIAFEGHPRIIEADVSYHLVVAAIQGNLCPVSLVAFLAAIDKDMNCVTAAIFPSSGLTRHPPFSAGCRLRVPSITRSGNPFRRKITSRGDRQMVEILSAVLTDGLSAVNGGVKSGHGAVQKSAASGLGVTRATRRRPGGSAVQDSRRLTGPSLRCVGNDLKKRRNSSALWAAWDRRVPTDFCGLARSSDVEDRLGR
jgi:hypothetical protein